MIVSRTPYRISFFGGGTDYPGWYRQHGGAVLATSIDKYCYLTCRYLPPFFEHRYRVVYSKIEDCRTIEEITHPAVREVLRFMKIERGVEIHHDGDLPARSGMGSSSSFTVGLLHALHALRGHMPSKEQLAKESIHIEQDALRETVGSQDQVLAAYGGLNHVTFHTHGEISVRPMTIPKTRVDELDAHLMLFYTGIKRTASDVAKSYVQSIDEKTRQLQLLSQLVTEATNILNSRQDLTAFGQLLHEAWQIKRSLSTQVTNSAVDQVYHDARHAGALGGKLTGAGGGGFMLLFAPPDQQPAIRERLHKLIHVPFQFEYAGSQIIFYDHEKDYSAAERDRDGRSIEAFSEL
jgi:D-glycero-alpha-D-manno-heptose-7-phosphate kinase